MGIQERKERERERRRQDILVAAKRVFSDKGFERSTIEDIAREAELSPGTLYLYFKNKDELYASLTVRVLQFMSVRLAHAIEEPGLNYDRKLANLIDAMFDIYEFDPVILNNMFHLQSSETLRDLSPELIEEINTLSRKSLRTIAAVFQEGMDEGRILRRHPTALADIFWSMFTGSVLWKETKQMIGNEQYPLKESIRLGFSLLDKGLRQQALDA